MLATKHTTFVAHLIDSCLTREGILVEIAEEYKSSLEKAALFVVICPQMFKALPKNFVAFQMEQSTSARWFTPEYFRILGTAQGVLDYSVDNIRTKQDGGLHTRVYFMFLSVRW